MKSAKDYFNLGYGARRSNLTKTANPLLFAKAWPHEAWNMGFDFADLEINAPLQSEAVLERVPANPFEQGRNAHIRGIAFEDCPYGEGSDQTAWQAGWISQVDEDGTGLFVGIWNALKYTLAAAAVIALMWALFNLPWPEASSQQTDCQNKLPPWQSAICDRPASP